jgi:hypothetical protein
LSTKTRMQGQEYGRISGLVRFLGPLFDVSGPLPWGARPRTDATARDRWSGCDGCHQDHHGVPRAAACGQVGPGNGQREQERQDDSAARTGSRSCRFPFLSAIATRTLTGKMSEFRSNRWLSAACPNSARPGRWCFASANGDSGQGANGSRKPDQRRDVHRPARQIRTVFFLPATGQTQCNTCFTFIAPLSVADDHLADVTTW